MLHPETGTLLQCTCACMHLCTMCACCVCVSGGQPRVSELFSALISYLAPSFCLHQAPELTDYTSEGHLGTAIPAGAAGEQGLWLHAAPSSTPCMPGCHPPGAPLPHHPSPGPQPRVSAVVGASHSAWLTSGEGRCPLRSHAGVWSVGWDVVG